MAESQHDMDGTGLHFVERMGQLLEADGFTRISGRILGHLMLTAGAVSLEELAHTLSVSKGSASQDTRTLEKLGAVERVTKPGDRRVYYQVADRMHERMLAVRLERFRQTRHAVQDGLSSAAAQCPVVRCRLTMVTEFFDHMIDAITATRDQWSDQRGKQE